MRYRRRIVAHLQKINRTALAEHHLVAYRRHREVSWHYAAMTCQTTLATHMAARAPFMFPIRGRRAGHLRVNLRSDRPPAFVTGLHRVHVGVKHDMTSAFLTDMATKFGASGSYATRSVVISPRSRNSSTIFATSTVRPGGLALGAATSLAQRSNSVSRSESISLSRVSRHFSSSDLTLLKRLQGCGLHPPHDRRSDDKLRDPLRPRCRKTMQRYPAQAKPLPRVWFSSGTASPTRPATADSPATIGPSP